MTVLCVLDPSASVAAYVPTVVAPSATLAEAVPPSVKIGVLSLMSVIVTVTVIVSVSTVSLAVNSTTQLLPAAQAEPES